jgi:isocitrate/isopropylmalate dehydrogenase
VLASAMMLEFLGWHPEAATLRSAVKAAVDANYVTVDLGGDKSTTQVGNWVSGKVSPVA